MGVQMAKALANQGCNVVCLARRKALVDENAAMLESEYGISSIGISCDITDTESIQNALDKRTHHRRALHRAIR